MDYAVTCQHCGQTVLKGETIRAEDVEPLAEHLRTQHPYEVVGVRTWKLTEVLRHYRVGTV